MPNYKNQYRNLLSSQARIQAPWIKVTFGDPKSNKANSYTFGIFDKKEKMRQQNNEGLAKAYDIQYPNYLQKLNIIKINGQVNQYTLNISYPIRDNDDPNFFEKIFSNISDTRKIIFSYGDSAMPSYCYKDEEAIITGVTQTFNLEQSKIDYVVKAVSSAALSKVGCFSFMKSGVYKPSDVIKETFKNTKYGLRSLFPAMNNSNLDKLIEGTDKAVTIVPQINISPLDYITYLVSCMVPAGSTVNSISKDIYILTIHDDTVYDQVYNSDAPSGGSYFKVEHTSYKTEHADAYELDIGYDTATIVSNFSIENNENYSLYYKYSEKLYPEKYIKRINDKGNWETIYAPTALAKNDTRSVYTNDITWWTKITQYPISATITVQGLLRPATLMQYLRLNVIFPGGNKHISSGLYIVTKQVDDISEQGYKTTLSLTKLGGDLSTNYLNFASGERELRKSLDTVK